MRPASSLSQAAREILVFDTETTGTGGSARRPLSNPRLVQLAWVRYDARGARLGSASMIVRPAGFEIPRDAVAVHGISTARALREGRPLDEVLDAFESALDQARVIVAHNLSFDTRVLLGEYTRSGRRSVFFKREKVCTQQAGTAFCKLPGRGGYKWPRLDELHKALFGKAFDGAHDALADAEAAGRCYWEMVRREIINRPFAPDEPPTRERQKPPSRAVDPALRLSGEQTRALEAVTRFIESPGRCFVLRGAAGTGKTFLVRHLLKGLELKRQPFQVLTPTGRAARVVRERTGYPARTIHSGIYSEPGVEYEKVEQGQAFTLRFALKANTDPEGTIYIVDEASMVSDQKSENDDHFLQFGSGRLLSDLITFAAITDPERDAHLLFIGDPAQLPPVGSPISPALQPDYLRDRFGLGVDTFELKEVQRQQEGSGILVAATRIRDAIGSDRYHTLDLDSSRSDLREIRGSEVVETYLERARAVSKDEAILIARSNREARGLNVAVRGRLFPDADVIVPGDRLIVVQNNPLYQVLNGDFVEVVDVSGTVETRRPLKDVVLRFREVTLRSDDGVVPRLIRCKLIETVLVSEERNLSPEEMRGLIVDFRQRNPGLKPQTLEFSEKVKSDPYLNAIRAKHGYAVTCHKAQGGEWDTAIVCFDGRTSGWDNEAFFRWTYTAITRARSTLLMVNPPHFTAISDLAFRPGIPAMETIERNVPGASGRTIEEKLRLVVQPAGATLDSVQSLPFRLRLFLSRGASRATVDLLYNGKNRITRAQVISNRIPDPDMAGLCVGVESLLNTLAGQELERIGEPGDATLIRPEFPRGQDHLLDLYKKLERDLAQSGIRITGVEHFPWSERYAFSKGAERAKIDFYYNGKGRFTRAVPVGKVRNEIIEVIESIWNP